MHSFEVHSNKSACRKSERLGLEQVFTAIVDWPTDTNIINILHLFLTVWCKKIQQAQINTQPLRGHSSYGQVQTHLQEETIHNPTCIRHIQKLDREGCDKDGSTSGRGKEQGQEEQMCPIWHGQQRVKKIHHGSRRQDVVQGARGPGHFQYEHHGPQTPRTPYQILFGSPCGRRCQHTATQEDAIQRLQRNPTPHQCNGGVTEKFHLCKTIITRQVHAHCGPQVSPQTRRVWNRNEGVVKTPWKPTNTGGVKNEVQGGVCGKATCRIRQKRLR